MMKVKVINLDKQEEICEHVMQAFICHLQEARVIDIGDIGNEIGLFIGQAGNDRIGFTKQDFIDGLNHGFNLAEKHGKKV